MPRFPTARDLLIKMQESKIPEDLHAILALRESTLKSVAHLHAREANLGVGERLAFSCSDARGMTLIVALHPPEHDRGDYKLLVAPLASRTVGRLPPLALLPRRALSAYTRLQNSHTSMRYRVSIRQYLLHSTVDVRATRLGTRPECERTES